MEATNDPVGTDGFHATQPRFLGWLAATFKKGRFPMSSQNQNPGQQSQNPNPNQKPGQQQQGGGQRPGQQQQQDPKRQGQDR